MAVLNCLVACFVVLIGGFVLNANHSQAETIKVVGVTNAPFLMKNGDFYEGFIPDILDSITQMIAVNYTLYNVSRYGRLDKDGQWDGMMNEVINGKADVAAMLTMTSARDKYVDFSYPIMSSGPAIILKRPQKERKRIAYSIGSLFEPFDITVWLVTILAFFVTSTALYMISHFNPYEWRRMFKDSESTKRKAESFTCMNSFWFSISAMALQGYVRAPRSVGGRIVVTAWWFFVVLLLLSYVASLTNLLRVGPKPLEAEGYSKIRVFSDLAKTGNINVLVFPNGMVEAFFQKKYRSTDAMIYQKMLEMRAVEKIEGHVDGVKMVRESPSSDTVMVMESTMAKVVSQQQPCDLYMVSDNVITWQQSFVFAAGSHFTSKFNNALLHLKESGRFGYLESKWFPIHCENSVDNFEESGTNEFPKFYKLDLGALFGAILILGVGLILGGLTTVVEVCMYKGTETHVDEAKAQVEPEANNRLIDDSAVLREGASQV